MSAVVMKDSGVEWLGEIPCHWDVKRLKHVASVRASNVDKTFKETETEISLLHSRVIYYREFLGNDVSFLSATATNQQIEMFELRKGDVVLTKDSVVRGRIAIPAYVQFDFTGVLPDYLSAIVRSFPNLSYGRFLARILASKPLLHQFVVAAQGVTISHLSQQKIGNVIVVVPPLHEQRAIADHLDRETARIDSLIAKTEALNVLLRERRVALISQAVTKGLDAGVAMKESGVEWLGEIPSHWDCVTLNALTLATSNHDPRTEPDLPFRYIDVSGISNSINQITGHEILLGYDAPSRARRVVFEGDTIFATVRPYLRNIAQIPGSLDDSICSTGYCVLRPDDAKLHADYLFYSCITDGFVESVVIYQRGSNYPAVSDRVVERQFIPLPPLDEQRAIADHLDRETARIDALINKNDELIALLREKRSALISAAVTGKISVPAMPSVVK